MAIVVGCYYFAAVVVAVAVVAVAVVVVVVLFVVGCYYFAAVGWYVSVTLAVDCCWLALLADADTWCGVVVDW